MASILNTSVYSITSAKAFKLFADSASIDVTSDDENVKFKSFSVVNTDNRNAFELVLTIDENDKKFTTPIFNFDETSSEFFLSNDEKIYRFTFYTKERMNVCTIKNLGL